MSEPSPTPIPTDAAEKTLPLLTRLFLSGPGGTPPTARMTTTRLAAVQLLARNNPPTIPKIRSAAVHITLSHGTLDVPGRSVPSDLTMVQIQRLRDDAIALRRTFLNRLRAAQKRPANDQTSDNPSAALPDDQGLNGPECRPPAEIEHRQLPSRLERHRDHPGVNPITSMTPARTRLGGLRRVVSAAFTDHAPITRKPHQD
jgi:hypothetical protein